MRFNKVLICGCARSGNTLMLNLMSHGFEGVHTLCGEIVPKQDMSGFTVIGKRPIELMNLERHLQTMAAILMVRYPKDVLISSLKRKHHVLPERWISTAKKIIQFEKHDKVKVVYYEKLILNHHDVQQELSEFLDLPINVPFNECYKYFNKKDKHNIQAMHGIRPLDESRVFAWKLRSDEHAFLNWAYKKYPEFIELENHFYPKI